MESTNWEYQVVTVDPKRLKATEGNISEGMRAYGAEGWELVTVIQQPDGWLYTFYKRPARKQEPQQEPKREPGIRLIKPKNDD